MPSSVRLKHVAPLSLLFSLAAAQGNNFTCIPLKGSTLCPSFSEASISTSLTANFPFLQYVANLEEFDTQFATFIKTDYVKNKFQDTMDCSGINLANTSYLYSRFTATVLCASMVQESIEPCQLSSAQSPPVCASTCADYATSEETIIMTPELCGGNTTSLIDLRVNLVRADFTVCALPANSLSSSCIQGLVNEPGNCGYGTNLVQLCEYCGRESPNATALCCESANLSACASINIPPTYSLPNLFTSTTTITATSTSTATAVASQHLSTGAIVGITIAAAIIGLILAGLIFILVRRRRDRHDPHRPLRQKTSSVPMSCAPFPERNGYSTIEDDSRVRRMTALHQETSLASAGGMGISSPEVTPPRGGRRIDNSSSSEANPLSSPEPGSPLMMGTLPPPPPASPTKGGGWGTTAGAAAGAAIVGAAVARSTGSGNGKRGSRSSTNLSSGSPGDVSEAASVAEVPDHYSSNIIQRQSDVVALWSYVPRLADEMALERGDVVRIENLYDDNWAIGRKLKTKIWDMESDARSSQRDSGIGTSHRESTSTAHRISLERAASGEPPATRSSDKGKEKEGSFTDSGSIKAFPMVCVCHREAWADVVAREEEESTSPTPDLGRRRISPTRMDLGVSDPQPSTSKETRFESDEGPITSSDSSPITRGMPHAPSRSSSQGSGYHEYSSG